MPNINEIRSPLQIQSTISATQKRPQENTKVEGQKSFKEILFDALNHVNKLQEESASATVKLAKGEIENLHDVMIAGQKASIALSATIEVRNKVIEAYQEIMRMQV